MPDASGVDIERLVRLHSTRVIDRDAHLNLDVMVIPRSALPEDPLLDLQGVAGALDLEIRYQPPLPSASFIPHAICALLMSPTNPDACVETFERLVREAPPIRDVPSSILNFATYCAFSEILGVEESRIRSAVMAAIVGAAGTIAVAVVAGMAAPVIIVAAAGVATAVGTVLVLTATVAVAELLYDKLSGPL